MTTDRARKRAIRAAADRNGLRYTEARRALLGTDGVATGVGRPVDGPDYRDDLLAAFGGNLTLAWAHDPSVLVCLLRPRLMAAAWPVEPFVVRTGAGIGVAELGWQLRGGPATVTIGPPTLPGRSADGPGAKARVQSGLPVHAACGEHQLDLDGTVGAQAVADHLIAWLRAVRTGRAGRPEVRDGMSLREVVRCSVCHQPFRPWQVLTVAGGWLCPTCVFYAVHVRLGAADLLERLPEVLDAPGAPALWAAVQALVAALHLAADGPGEPPPEQPTASVWRLPQMVPLWLPAGQHERPRWLRQFGDRAVVGAVVGAVERAYPLARDRVLAAALSYLATAQDQDDLTVAAAAAERQALLDAHELLWPVVVAFVVAGLTQQADLGQQGVPGLWHAIVTGFAFTGPLEDYLAPAVRTAAAELDVFSGWEPPGSA